MPREPDPQSAQDAPISSSRGVSRSWLVSVLAAAALTGVAVGISSVVNPLIGRTVHWDWMAVLAPLTFVVAMLYLRRR